MVIIISISNLLEPPYLEGSGLMMRMMKRGEKNCEEKKVDHLDVISVFLFFFSFVHRRGDDS